MTDLIKQLESGIEVNGVYQQVIPIICYIDIPIQMIIKKLELMDNKSNEFFEFLNSRSPVITNWIKSNPNETFTISNYINFLQTHLATTRDFIRFGLNSVPGIYVKNSDKNDEFIALDEDYIKNYEELVLEFDLEMDKIPVSIDLRSIPSNKVRPTLKWSEKADESIKTIFCQT